MNHLTMCYRYFVQRYMKKSVDACEKPARNKRADKTTKQNKKR